MCRLSIHVFKHPWYCIGNFRIQRSPILVSHLVSYIYLCFKFGTVPDLPSCVLFRRGQWRALLPSTPCAGGSSTEEETSYMEIEQDSTLVHITRSVQWLPVCIRLTV